MKLNNFESAKTFPEDAKKSLIIQKQKIKNFFNFFKSINLTDKDIWLESEYSVNDNGYFWEIVFSSELQKKIENYRYVLIKTHILEKFWDYLNTEEYPDLQILYYYNEEGNTKECVVGSETMPELNLVMPLNTARIFLKIRNYPHQLKREK